MSYTLIDYFRGFHDLKQKLNLSASAQAVYLSLVGEFNTARFPEQLSISDRALATLAGLKSVATAHDAKRILKNAGLIDFKSDRGSGTVYTLMANHLSKGQPNTYRTLTEHLPNTCRTVGGSSYIHVREEEETSFLPSDLPADARAHARVNTELDKAVDYWHDTIGGGKLTVEMQSRLGGVLTRYDLGWLKAAMDEAAAANRDRRGCSPKWLFACIERLENPQPLRIVKGSEKRGNVVATSASSASPVGYGGNESDTPEWAR